MNANWALIEVGVDDDDARIDSLLATDTSTATPNDLTSGTTIGGVAAGVDGANCSVGNYPRGVDGANAAQDCAVDDDVPDAGDFGVATDLDANGELEAASVNASEVAADVATQAELDAKSAGTSTDLAVAKFSGTTGDIVNSAVTIDASNNLNVPGTITSGAGSGAACLILRDSDNAGDSACAVLNGTFSCQIDTNGVCGDSI
jgi:hypothetical protein